MNLFDQIGEDIKKAMLAKDNVRRDTLRNVKKEFLEAKTAKAGDDFDDAQAIQILRKMVKKGEDAAQIFMTQNREDLAQEELSQVAVLKQYLPATMSVEEVEKVVSELISQLGVTSIKEMGKVMGAVSKQLSGRTDNKTISEVIKKMLS
ncbi:MAG: GatB/YqeY domain-containing protein [Paludibacteraceae bacterium]|nr:GatB/YqeY domain-containing protein [Paludibacteraceae bacterium]